VRCRGKLALAFVALCACEVGPTVYLDTPPDGALLADADAPPTGKAGKYFCLSNDDCADESKKVRCNVAESECVECLADGDCAAPERPFCRTSDLKCIECREDGDCAAPRTCDPMGHCM
jgi:hypothetical protein